MGTGLSLQWLRFALARVIPLVLSGLKRARCFNSAIYTRNGMASYAASKQSSAITYQVLIVPQIDFFPALYRGKALHSFRFTREIT